MPERNQVVLCAQTAGKNFYLFEKYIGLISSNTRLLGSIAVRSCEEKKRVEYEKAFGFGKLQTVSGV